MSQSILFVEDATDVLEMYKVVFRRKPYGIYVAASGEAALELLEQESDVALVLLDLNLPGVRGEEVIERIRSQPKWRGLKVMLLSGWDGLNRRAAEVGADAYMRKPVYLPELESQIDSLLEQSRIDNQLPGSLEQSIGMDGLGKVLLEPRA